MRNLMKRRPKKKKVTGDKPKLGIRVPTPPPSQDHGSGKTYTRKKKHPNNGDQ